MEKQNMKAWLYLLPAFLFLGAFMIYPLIDVFVYSFEEGYNSASQTFYGTGMYNYSYVLHDPYFLQALKNTFILVIITVPVSTGLALLISAALSSIKPLRDLFQTIFFLPYVTNTLAVGLVFMILFKKTPYSDGLINLLIQFFGHGRVYALENPGHRKIARVYQANQVAVRPIGMDADGVIPELLEQSGAEVLHISPSHHYPTGTVTPITRRQALMRWLTAQPGRYLIEDDYDSEFRFSGLPIPTIQSMDRSGRVIYMNTFSRTISPSLRISYMILPRTLLPQWQTAMGFYSCTVPSFEQMTLTRFLAEGYFEKHLSRMKKHYRAVRAQLFSVLHTPQAVRQCAVHDTDAGLHLVLELKNAPEPEALRALLRQSGLPDALLSDFFLDAPSPQAQKSIVLGYADAEPAQLEAALTALFTRLEAREAPV